MIALSAGLTSARIHENWLPQTLFANSEQGYLYPLIPNKSLFQDASGTTAVTDAGQSVGLCLDTRLSPGPQLVANGSFADGLTGWSFEASGVADENWSLDGNRLLFEGEEKSGLQNVRYPCGMVPGKTYLVAFEYQVASGQFSCGLINAATVGGRFLTGTGRRQFIVTTTSAAQTGPTIGPENINAYCKFWIWNLSVRELPGNHAFQSTALNRPIFRLDEAGRSYLEFNGTNSWLQTTAFAWGSDAVTILAGLRKTTDVAQGILLEFGSPLSSQNGSFNVSAPLNGAGDGLSFSSKGTAATTVTSDDFDAPGKAILTLEAKIAAPFARLMINQAAALESTETQGTGIFGSHSLYLGSRAGSSLFFNGRFYPVLAINRSLTNTERSAAQAWITSKTGAY